MTLPKMSKAKMAAIAAIVIWPISFLLGYRSGMANLAAGAAVFLWIFQLAGDVPEQGKRKRNLGHRPM